MRGSNAPVSIYELSERIVDDFKKTRAAEVLDHFSKKEGETILPDEIRERPISKEVIREFVNKVLPSAPKSNPFNRLNG